MPSFCTAWRWSVRRGSWRWWSEQKPAGVGAERVEKERGQCERKSSRKWTNQCLEWTNMSLAERALPSPHPRTSPSLLVIHQNIWCRRRVRGECSISPSTKAIVVCGEVPLFLKVELVTFSPIKRWLNDASFVQRNECCKRSGFMQGNDSHRGGIWCLLSKSLNVSDPDVNAWPPECVVHDIDPLQLLETDCSLPMVSVEGNCIRVV